MFSGLDKMALRALDRWALLGATAVRAMAKITQGLLLHAVKHPFAQFKPKFSHGTGVGPLAFSSRGIVGAENRS
jgi:hypothetical protein